MDPISITLAILSLLFAGGGIWTFLAAKATAKATREAAQAAADAANRQAATADWSGLMAYWQSEIKALRDDNKELEVRLILLEERRENDLQHIDDLTQHIWQQLPPPPPLRRLPRNDLPKAP